MKESILEILRSGESLSTAELAEITKSTPEMLLAKLEHYAVLGYVKRIEMCGQSCSGSCGKCRGCSPSSSPCNPVVYWELIK